MSDGIIGATLTVDHSYRNELSGGDPALSGLTILCDSSWAEVARKANARGEFRGRAAAVAVGASRSKGERKESEDGHQERRRPHLTLHKVL